MLSESQKRLSTILNKPFQDYIEENKNADLARLLLAKNSPVDVKQAADQILSWRKTRDKLPDWFAAKGIVFPPPLSIEQSSSQAAADYKKTLLSGHYLVDLTGGMGVDCLALCQKFEQTTDIEQNEWLCTLFRHNQKILSDKEIAVVNATAEEYLDTFSGKACFFIDPARRDADKKKVFRFEDCSPDLTLLIDVLNETAEKVLVKAAPLIDLSLGISQLEYVKEVHVLSIKNEVKEVLFLLDFSVNAEPNIHCINLNDNHPSYTFTFTEEKHAKVTFSDTKKYVYEPNSAILKAGAFKSITSYFPVKKLSTNTHLYTSDQLLDVFPGRKFEVIKTAPKKSDLKNLLPEGKANVFTKNYPLRPEALKKKLGVKDGGEFFIIGFRDHKEKPQLILTRTAH